MSSSTSLMAQLLVVAFLAVVGMAIYTFMTSTKLEVAQAHMADVQKDRDSWKAKYTQYQTQSKMDQDNLQQCQAQVKDLQTQADAAAAKKPVRR